MDILRQTSGIIATSEKMAAIIRDHVGHCMKEFSCHEDEVQEKVDKLVTVIEWQLHEHRKDLGAQYVTALQQHALLLRTMTGTGSFFLSICSCAAHRRGGLDGSAVLHFGGRRCGAGHVAQKGQTENLPEEAHLGAHMLENALDDFASTLAARFLLGNHTTSKKLESYARDQRREILDYYEIENRPPHRPLPRSLQCGPFENTSEQRTDAT